MILKRYRIYAAILDGLKIALRESALENTTNRGLGGIFPERQVIYINAKT